MAAQFAAIGLGQLGSRQMISQYFWILEGLSLHQDFSACSGPISKIKKDSGSIDTWPTSKLYISHKYDL